MEVSKNPLWDADAKLFASMEEGSLTPNEANFFKNMQFKEEYEPTALNDLLVSEYENTDEIYLVRVEFDEYLVGHGIGTDGAEEVHTMNLSEALAVNFKTEGFLDRDITLWQWLREKDYAIVNYDRNHDLTDNG
jgi:L-alanine-DL-glutamate epimerase-like enolase superfamily enzyme